jgi:F-type H+-transporting ATPase subunit gamma
MPSLRDIKRRIKSVKSTQQITKAMKMVSAAKLKRAQDDILAARPYAAKMVEITSSLASKTGPGSHPLLSGPAMPKAVDVDPDAEGEGPTTEPAIGRAFGRISGLKGLLRSYRLPGKDALREERSAKPKAAVVLITSDRGLCGSFNAVLLRTAERFLKGRTEDTGLYLIGKRGMEYFKRRPTEVLKSRPVGGARPNYSIASEIAHDLMGSFLRGEYSEVHVIYSEFKSALTQRPVVERLLPISDRAAQPGGPEASTEGAEERQAEAFVPPPVEFIFEPSKDALLGSLLPKFIEVQVFKTLLESSASEHGARMTAMDSASKNATEMIGALTLKYNRLRQAAITKELMEIIGGAEALKG